MRRTGSADPGTSEVHLVFRMSALILATGQVFLVLTSSMIWERECSSNCFVHHSDRRRCHVPRRMPRCCHPASAAPRPSVRGAAELFLHTSSPSRPLLAPRVHSRSVSIWGRSTLFGPPHLGALNLRQVFSQATDPPRIYRVPRKHPSNCVDHTRGAQVQFVSGAPSSLHRIHPALT